jgi:hypothetical protein
VDVFLRDVASLEHFKCVACHVRIRLYSDEHGRENIQCPAKWLFARLVWYSLSFDPPVKCHIFEVSPTRVSLATLLSAIKNHIVRHQTTVHHLSNAAHPLTILRSLQRQNVALAFYGFSLVLSSLCCGLVAKLGENVHNC